MIEINLTTFVDIATSVGMRKIGHVRRLKQRGQYHPAHDFYRQLREAIVECHRSGTAKATLDNLMYGITERNKLTAFPPLIAAYKQWMGRKEFAWFNPPRSKWSHGGVGVLVNPELGLGSESRQLALKLYFKKDPLTKRQVDVVLHLLNSIVEQEPNAPIVGLLDIRRGKVLRPTVRKSYLEAALRAEVAYIRAAWSEV